MRRLPSLLALLAALLGALSAATVAPRALVAQVTETPATFDSAGRVVAITPALAARLRLAAPAWPVDGAYTEARLYLLGETEERVLVVQRPNGALERHSLPADRFRALREAVDAGTRVASRPVGEERANEVSESAKGHFIRNQLAAAATIYGGSIAELMDDPQRGTAAYLLSVGGAFFAAAAISKNINVSRAQNHLATDAALRGSLMARGLAYSLGVDGDDGSEPSCTPDPLSGCDYDDGYDDRDEDILAASILVGGIGGSVLAFQYGRGLTDGEAKASTFGSTVAALTAAGVLGTVGAFDGGEESRRAAVAGIVGAGILGYPLGLAYPRRASHRVTSGDIGALGVSAALGVLAASVPLFAHGDPSPNVASAVLTAGMLGGLVLGDAALVRQYDFTEGEAALLGLGALAGGVMGTGLVVLAAPENDAGAVAMSVITAGAVLGTLATVRLVEPRRAGAVRSSAAPGARRREALRGERPRLSLAPEGAALAAAGIRGRHSILRVTF